MKEQELNIQLKRISQYRTLEKVRDEIYAAIKAITSDHPDGPCGQGPFTGNTRESRQVQSIHFVFSATRGGAAPVEMKISGLYIEARELGKAIEKLLRTKVELVNSEMENL